MSKYKMLGIFLLLISLLAVQANAVYAAPLSQSGTVTGTVQSCTTSKDALTGAIIVVCDINLSGGGTQTVRLSLTDAVSLGLVVLNPDGTVSIIATPGQAITIDTSLILADPCALPTGASQPVGEALTGFFCGSLGLDYNTIQALHTQGFGYGLIAQACFMAGVLGGTGNTCESILMAKQTGNYSGLILPGGVTVSNWGQLRKLLFAQGNHSLMNLGAIMSGRAPIPTLTTPTTLTTTTNGKPNKGGNGNGKGNGGGNGKGNGH